MLYAARLIPTAFTFRDDVRLPSCGLALTNIVSRATRAASELTRAEYAVGVTVYRAFFGAAATPGPGAKPQRIGPARVFVLPNPSGLNAAYPGFRDKLIWFKRLKRYTSLREDSRCD